MARPELIVRVGEKLRAIGVRSSVRDVEGSAWTSPGTAIIRTS